MTSSCSTSNSSTPSERKSAFVPVPPSAATAAITTFMSPGNLTKRHQQENVNLDYSNQLLPPLQPYLPPPQLIPPLPPVPTDFETKSSHLLNSYSSQMESFPPYVLSSANDSSLYHNNSKLRIRVSDSNIAVSDVSDIKQTTTNSHDKKRKQNVLSATTRKILKAPNVDTTTLHGDKTCESKVRKTRTSTTTAPGSNNNNNNSQIQTKEEDSNNIFWDDHSNRKRRSSSGDTSSNKVKTL